MHWNLLNCKHEDNVFGSKLSNKELFIKLSFVVNTLDVEEMRNISKIAHEDVIHPSYDVSLIVLLVVRKLLDECICCQKIRKKAKTTLHLDKNNVLFILFFFTSEICLKDGMQEYRRSSENCLCRIFNS